MIREKDFTNLSGVGVAQVRKEFRIKRLRSSRLLPLKKRKEREGEIRGKEIL